MTHTVHADRYALTLTGPPIPGECSLSVLLGSRRIWTFRVSGADASVLADRFTVRWPPALAARLSGSAELRLLMDGVLVAPPGRVRFDDSGNEFKLEEPGTGIPQVVNKWGRIGRSFEGSNASLIDDVLDEAESLISLVKKRAGLDLFVTGGTLLGPVRDGRLMPHDDDVDLAYLSSHENPSDIALESFRLEQMLGAEGHEIVRHSAGHLQLMFPGKALHDRFYIDIFTYFTVSGWFHGPFHARERAQDVQVLPLKPLTVNARQLPAPANPQQMLTAIYGPGWRTPDPAFRFLTPPPARRRFDGWLNSFDADRENWEDHHRTELAAGSVTGPSAWSRQLAGWLPARSRILELGCGLGSDARYFADQGHDVLAVDYSRPALHAIAALPRPGLRVARVNLNSVRQVASLASACYQEQGPLHIYARLLLNALSAQGLETTLSLIAHILRSNGGNGRAYLEVETAPGSRTYSCWTNYRPLNPASLCEHFDIKGLQLQEASLHRQGSNGAHTHAHLTIKARTP